MVFNSAVGMAIPPVDLHGESSGYETMVYVTPNAREKLNDSEIWHHLDGWNDGGDSYETQESQFSQHLDRF
jgi:hypothetical protein